MKKQMKRALAALLCISALFSLTASAVSAETPESQAAKIVSRLTLEEKIGQMMMPLLSTWNGENMTVLSDEIAGAIRDYNLGSIGLLAGCVKGTESGTALICDLQAAALSSSSGLPLIVTADQEGGYITRLGTGTETCGCMALGAAGDPMLTEETGAILGRELAAMGINVNCAPDADVNNNPANPVIGIRSFSDDPETVSAHVAAYVRGLHSAGVGATLKHFPGHGDTAVDSHSGLPCIDKTLDELKKFELIPFAAGIEAGADMVMTAHIQYPQIETETYLSKYDGKPITLPATLSKTIITDLLRNEMGYDGVICTDALNMSAITQHFDRMDAAKLAINAGVDILMIPVSMTNSAGVADCGAYRDGIVQMVRSGEIPEATVDASVTRIVAMKLRRGMTEKSYDKAACVANALAEVGSARNHEAEWRIMEQAVTLVRNDGLLPLRVRNGERVVLFCSYANELNSLRYAVERLRSVGLLPKGADVQIFCYNNLSSLTSEQMNAVKQADAVVASVEMYKAANLSSGWQASFLDQLIDLVHANGAKIAVISLQLPYDLARYQKADALLAAYGSMGMNVIPTVFDGETAAYGVNLPAAVCAVFGAFHPTGTLPVDIPKLDSAGQFTAEVLYSRGFGITTGFDDVSSTDFCAEAVQWAVMQRIITGTSVNTFSPKRKCTRAEAVTMMWRAAGSPAADAAISFTDVPANAYYAPAVRWAAANGITGGTGNGKFSPNAVCTRAQIVTLLARMAGVTSGKTDTGFSDVPADAYYAAAVRWAVDNGITFGTGSGKFSPDAVCTREQIVTFLWRDMQ